MVSPLRPALLALFVASCGPLALEPAAPDSTFQSRWHEEGDRVWVGERHWANRLQDWRVQGGRLECVEARPGLGMRTLHLLTHWLGGETPGGEGRKSGSFRSRVLVDAAEGDRSGSAAGFLVGAGGAAIDYRLTSQVHGTSAEDGGYLALVDGEGRAFFADFETPVEGGSNQWTMSSKRSLDDFGRPGGVELAGQGFGAAGPEPVVLEVVGASYDGRRTLTLTAESAATGEVLSTAYWEDAPLTALDGSMALVSHRGPAGAGGYAFEDWLLAGDLVQRDSSRSFGPIMFVHYTVDVQPDGTAQLGLTAQAGPLGPSDAQTATLELAPRRGDYETVAEASFVPDSATFHFVVPGLDPDLRHRFRVRYAPIDGEGEEIENRVATYTGWVPEQPKDGIKIGVLNCQKSYTGGLRWNESGLWFPHKDVQLAMELHEPDMLYFAGDQIYEGDLSGAVREPLDAAMNDYLHKWYRHGWSFRALTRKLPAVVVPDDHDVYHGNVWGNGGVRMESDRKLSKQDRGGYVMPPDFVNAVHRTQVAHLPKTADATGLLPNGITTYYTDLNWGGGSFAILGDRMYKSPPSILVPEGDVVNGLFRAEGFDPATEADVPGAVLLGEAQEAFLESWGSDWSGAWFKACLSQTPFANVATLPNIPNALNKAPSWKIAAPGEYLEGDLRAADGDSNGWPQTPRDRAVSLLRAAGAFHLTGDQHLGSTLRYGVDEFDDAGYVLSSPAVANTWPRRWFPNPAERQSGPPLAPNAPAYTGRYFDGFGNRMTVHAIANPRANGIEPARLHSRAPGYGVVEVVRDSSERGGGRVTFEAWPRRPLRPGELENMPVVGGGAPYPGWPLSFPLGAADGRQPVGYLPRLELDLEDGQSAVLEVRAGGELVYARPIVGDEDLRPSIFDRALDYEVRVTAYGADGREALWSWARESLRAEGEGSTASIPVGSAALLDGPK